MPQDLTDEATNGNRNCLLLLAPADNFALKLKASFAESPVKTAVIKKGSCLCGRVTFVVAGELKPPDACHCVKCRKHSGHYFASTDVPKAPVAITGEENLTWFHSSTKVRRGFCSTCGSSLFFDPSARDWIGIAMGAFDTPTTTKLEMHIFVAEKGDYYEISDGLPQNQR